MLRLAWFHSSYEKVNAGSGQGICLCVSGLAVVRNNGLVVEGQRLGRKWKIFFQVSTVGTVLYRAHHPLSDKLPNLKW